MIVTAHYSLVVLDDIVNGDGTYVVTKSGGILKAAPTWTISLSEIVKAEVKLNLSITG
jgi:hypothetical protein